ncbi:MAG: hypothetical protein GPOALKHO_000738 [Sodalis sp.]|uniref:PqiC family protein n=1 Tax=Sodalis sp. (in: enterobacteria) TaxID=1898979 RepID=UPI003872CDFE|nr:MAG: hypothetical protein GPOALKHO_000738 [Sodalis sp.]
MVASVALGCVGIGGRFLASNGLVCQTSDVQYITARSNLWASLAGTTVTAIACGKFKHRATRGTLVFMQPIGNNGDNDQLAVTITGFHVRYDGRAVVQGMWAHDGRVIRQPFNLTLPQKRMATIRWCVPWFRAGKRSANKWGEEFIEIN